MEMRFQEVVGARADFIHDSLVREGGEKGERSYAPCASCPSPDKIMFNLLYKI